MSKSLISISLNTVRTSSHELPNEAVERVARQRVQNETFGLGYWAAKDYLRKQGAAKKAASRIALHKKEARDARAEMIRRGQLTPAK